MARCNIPEKPLTSWFQISKMSLGVSWKSRVPDTAVKGAVKFAIKEDGRILIRLMGVDVQQVHGEHTHPIPYLSEPAYPTVSGNSQCAPQ